MGYGDALMASGQARGAAERGIKIAFGDGRRILWGKCEAEIFRGNPNVAKPGEEDGPGIKWIRNYKGCRPYHRPVTPVNGAYSFNRDFRATPGELFFTESELGWAAKLKPGFVLIEPHVKLNAPNKAWSEDRWRELAKRLKADGHDVVQFDYGRQVYKEFRGVPIPSFRHALAALTRAKLAILPEGGLHHGCAAVGTKAVVIFGGFTHPDQTGYDGHVNIFTGGAPCGRIVHCEHCRKAMAAITVDMVHEAAASLMGE